MLLSIVLMGLGIATAGAQSFPSKPVRIVTTDVGGGLDASARLLAPGLTQSLGQQVIVDNRGGAGGAIAAEAVAKAAPDGHTIIYICPPLWLLPLMRSNLPYDPVRDFTPITQAVRLPNLIVVHPSLPVKTVNDLIALAKKRPGELNYGTSGTGTSPHLAAELFKSAAGVNIVRVNYKGAALALNSLLGGEIQVFFPNVATVMPHVKSGRVRALAVTTAQPSDLAPGLPTAAASGVPGYESIAILGLFAPAKTPEAIVRRLNQEIVQVLNRPDVKEKHFNLGVETVASTPAEFAAVLKAEITKWSKTLKDAGIGDQ